MAAMSLGGGYVNPYEVTALQIAGSRAQAIFRSRHRRDLRERLRATDRLLDQVEHTRLQDQPRVPAATWAAALRLAGEVDPSLCANLRHERHPDRVGAALFLIQGRLLEQARGSAEAGLAPVIPLFPPG